MEWGADMLGIKLSDPMKPYSAADLRTGLRLVVSNSQPTNSSRMQPAASTTASRALLGSFPDGERTHALTQVVGRMLAVGLEPEEVAQLAQDWNARQSPPLDPDKVLSTVESLAKTDARNHPERQERGSHEGPLTPLFDLSEADIGMLLRTSPQPRRWLLQDMLPLGVVGMIVAPGGTGKSQFVLQLGVSVATGIPLCELWKVGEQGTALLLLAEDERDEVHRRLDRIVKELAPINPSMANDLSQRLLIKSMTARDNLMTRKKPHGTVATTGYVDRLLLTVAGIPDLKLIVIDPASRFRGGDENSADDVTRFVEEMERIRQATGATVLVCHHANKASMNESNGMRGQSATRGSSAMTDGVRWQLNLAPPQKNVLQALDASKRYLSAELAKSNYGPPIESEILIRKSNGYLTSVRAGGVAVTLDDRVLQLIRTEQAASRSYSASMFEKTFGGEDGQLAVGFNSVAKAIKRLIDSGKVRKEKGKLAALMSSPPSPGP